MLHDAHCHLDFIENGEAVARDAAREGAVLFANTVTPDGYRIATRRFEGMPGVRVGLGLHPWWVKAKDDALQVLDLLDSTRFVGEVGLDFGRRHESTREDQVEAFSLIARACGAVGGKTLSIHSVKAAHEALDILCDNQVNEGCTCIFHWYSGPSDQLKRAIDVGCYFSVNMRMLATGKGREYVKAIPASRLLLETDAPPNRDAAYPWPALRDHLLSVESAIERIKGADSLSVIDQNAQEIFGA